MIVSYIFLSAGSYSFRCPVGISVVFNSDFSHVGSSIISSLNISPGNVNVDSILTRAHHSNLVFIPHGPLAEDGHLRSCFLL